jgi:uncharacterized protein YlzI (FlbEa/FlbD family)
MIRLFRHDGLELMLNIDMIKDINAGTDTVITLVNGEELKVKNSLTDVLTKIRAYRQGIEVENQEYDAGAKGCDRSRHLPATRPAPVVAAAFSDPGQQPEEPS